MGMTRTLQSKSFSLLEPEGRIADAAYSRRNKVCKRSGNYDTVKALIGSVEPKRVVEAGHPHRRRTAMHLCCRVNQRWGSK